MAAPTNSIIYTGIGDESTAEAMSLQYALLLKDRSSGFLSHPALFYIGSINGGTSAVLKLPEMGTMGYDLLVSTTDGNPVGDTALTDSSATVTVGKYAKSVEMSDMCGIVAGKLLNADIWAMDAIVSANMTLVSLVAALFSGFSVTVGTSGVNATLQNFLDARTQLALSAVTGELLCVLHPVQWGDIVSDLALNSGGAITFDAASMPLLAVSSIGYQGKLLGVDVYTSNYVATANAGADRAGAMFGRGAILWADGVPSIMPGDPFATLIAGKVLFEVDRARKGGTTAFVSTVYLGVIEGQDLAGVGIVTDA